MSFRINTNVPSVAAQRSLSKTVSAQEKALQKLASGSRINSSADDAAGLAISEKMKGHVRSLKQADRNTNDGISLVQVAEGSLNEINSILVRLRELSVQAASDTIGDTERGFSDVEFQQLKSEIQRITQTTEFNGSKLLNGQGDKLDFQVGIFNNGFEDRVSYDQEKLNTTINSLGMGDTGVTHKESAQTNLNTIDDAIGIVAANRADLGATQNRLVSASQGIQYFVENLSAARSRISDTDYAEVTAENAKLNILQSSGTAVLTQANVMGQNALRLIGG
ncbi:MAG: flagellin FliC [Bacteriovoracaceae bacterium]|nr:flagellin FliC [Bacteriovoracaceae bacterium]